MTNRAPINLNEASATALSRAIREREVSSLEVIGAHLERIDALNPKLNAVVQLDADGARDQARKADAALEGGDALGPLHGVPFTVKDWIEAAGVICAAGSKERVDYVPKRDATVVARLREAGAVILGKTNAFERDTVYGKTKNPYDLSRTPGGSSSGEAAIIAAGGSPLGLGSDSGGSIRVPAHYCGIAGLKPTSGRVPNTGHFPRIGALSDPRTQIGVLARHVEDLALAFPIIAGEDGRDAGVVPMPLADHDAVSLSGLRVAWYTEYEGASPTPDTVWVVGQAVEVLRDAGPSVEEARPDMIERSLEITQWYWRRMRSFSWERWLTGGEEGTMTGEEIERSIFEWEKLQRSFLAFMEGYDVIVCPAAPGPAGEKDGLDDFIYTLPYSLTGQPCVVVRAGTSEEGLPLGVQIVARGWREDIALAVARKIEEALGGWQPPAALIAQSK